jgi:multiple sugar transport system substrate-binding protein
MLRITKRRLLGTGVALAVGALMLGGAVAAEAAEIRVMVTIYSDKTQPLFEDAARAFEAANPGTTVKIEMVPWDNALQKLTTDISGGSAPDLAIIGTRWLVDFVKNDAVEPLDDRLKDGTGDIFIETFLGPGRLDGKIYGLPIAASARALYYNKDLFEKAGVEPPKTWDDLHAAAQKISGLGGDTYGFGLQGKEIETDVYFYYAMWSYGGSIIGEDGKSGLGSDAALKALTLYKTMIDDGSTQKGVTTYTRENVQELFKAGKVGMMATAPFLANQIKDEGKKINYGIIPVPAGDAGKNFTYGVTDSFVMFKSSENKDAAWAFTKFVFQPEWRVRFTSGEGFLPTTKDEAKDKAFTENADLKTFVELLPNAQFAPTIAGWEDIADTTVNALQKVYNGEAEPKAALEEAAGEVNEVLEQ